MIVLEELWKLLFEGLYFRTVTHQNVRIVGVIQGIVLVVSLGIIKPLQRHNLGHDRLAKDFGCIQLRDVGVADFLLLVVGIEDDER